MNRWLISVLFIAYIGGPAIAGVLGVQSEVFENRRAAERPDWSAAQLVDAEAWAGLSDWLRDGIPLRSQAVSIDAWVDLYVFGDSPSGAVLMGPAGDLFLKGSLVWPCAPAARTDRVMAALDELADGLAARGTPLYVALSPNKASLQADRLPEIGRRMDRCGSTRRAALRARLSKSEAFTWVDLWSVFEAEAANDDPLFPKQGRHWSPRAGLLQARAIVQAIDEAVWSEAAVVRRDELLVEPAELPLRFMHLELGVAQSDWTVERSGLVVHHERRRLGPGTFRKVDVYRVDEGELPVVPGRTVIVYDSFMDRSRDVLSLYFESVEFVHWGDVALLPDQAAARLAEADRVVLQLVEDKRGERLAEGALNGVTGAAPGT